MPETKQNDELKVIRIPETMPILPLFNMLVFPKMMLPMEVAGDQSVSLVDEAMSQDRIIGLLLAKQSPVDTNYKPEDFHAIGTTVVILKMAKGADKKAQLLVQGIGRFRVKEFIQGKPYLEARVEALEDLSLIHI